MNLVNGHQSVTEAGRVLQAPTGAFFSSKPPMAAGAMRGMVLSLVGLVLTALVETLRQWQGLPPWIYSIWSPVLVLALRVFEAWRDQQSVVSP